MKIVDIYAVRFVIPCLESIKFLLCLISMSDDDRIPFNGGFITNLKKNRDEARRRGRIGGKKLGENNRKRREDLIYEQTLAQRIANLFKILTKEAPKTIKKNQDLTEEQKQLQIEIVNAVGYDMFKILQIMESPKSSFNTKLEALKMLHDRTDGKAIQKQEITGADGKDINPPVINFVPFKDDNDK